MEDNTLTLILSLFGISLITLIGFTWSQLRKIAGGPALDVDIMPSHDLERHELLIFLYNQPIKKGWRKWLAIGTEAATDVDITLQLWQHPNSRMPNHTSFHLRLKDIHTGLTVRDIPVSIWPLSLPVVRHRRGAAPELILQREDRLDIDAIDAGVYTLGFAIKYVRAGIQYEWKRKWRFRVGESYEETNWL